MALTSYMRPVDHTRLTTAADWLALATAVSLPWSTSATGILVVLWLIALIPTLNYAENNPDQFGMGSLAFLLAVTTVGCAVLYAAASLALRGRGAPALAAFITFLGVGWFFGYRRVAGILTGDAAHAPHLLLVPAALVLSVVLVWWIRRRERLLDGLGRFLTLMTALLVGYAAVRIGRDWRQGSRKNSGAMGVTGRNFGAAC